MERERNPKVSVIVPAFNAEKYLRRCLDSIIQQEYSNLEIILIDDGSTDRTYEIINEYVCTDKRVTGFHQKNEGLVAVRNRGIEIASGEYIGFVDSDDCISTDMYGRLVKNATENNADISVCGIKYVFDSGEPIDHWGTGLKTVLGCKEALEELLIGKWIEPSLCNKLYKKEIISDSCISTEIINNEDLLRNYIAFERTKQIVFEDFCGYIYFRHNESMSNNSDILGIARDILTAQELLVGVCEKKFINILMRSYVLHAISIINRLCKHDSRESDILRKKCRKIIVDNKKYLREIAFVQQMEGIIILISVRLYRLIYLFMKKFDKRRI